MPTVERFFGAFSNPSRSPLTNYDTALFADSRVLQAWDADASRVTVASGAVSRVNPRKPGGQALIQPTAIRQPDYVASHPLFGDRPVINFDQSPNTNWLYPETNTFFPVNADFTIVAIQLLATAAGTTFLGGGTAGSTTHTPTNGVGTSIQNTGMRVGASGAQASAVAPVSKDTMAHLCVYTWDDSAKQVGVAVDGGNFVTGINASAVSNDATFSWGYTLGGSGPTPNIAAAVMVLNVELLTGNADLLTLLRKYARDVFGINT